MENNVTLSFTAHSLWPKILESVEEPQIVLVCKLFKAIYYDMENTYAWLSQRQRFKALLPPSESSLEEKLTLAKTKALTRFISHRPQSTLEGVKNYAVLPFHGFIRLFEEENALNLLRFFSKIPLEKPSFAHLNLLDEAKAIRAFLKENGAQLASIERLNLQGMEITQVPEELNLLTGLKKINLSGNEIGSLPPSFGRFWDKLQECDLGFNQLTELPYNLGKKWEHLQILHLKNNKLKALPKEFGINWSALEELNLNFNQLEELPSDFGSTWGKLKDLGVDRNQLKDLPENYEKVWQSLSFLRIKKNPLDPRLVNELQKTLKNLLLLY